MEQRGEAECQYTVWPPPPQQTTQEVARTSKKTPSLLAELGWAVLHTFNCVVLLPNVPRASEGTWAAVSHYGVWVVLPALALGSWATVLRRVALRVAGWPQSKNDITPGVPDAKLRSFFAPFVAAELDR